MTKDRHVTDVCVVLTAHLTDGKCRETAVCVMRLSPLGNVAFIWRQP